MSGKDFMGASLGCLERVNGPSVHMKKSKVGSWNGGVGQNG